MSTSDTMLRIVSIVLISKKRFKILLSNMLWRKELIENDGGPHWFAHDRIWEGLGLAWLGKPGMLPSTGLQRVRHDWMTELNWTCLAWLFICFMWLQLGWLGQEDPLPRPLFNHTSVFLLLLALCSPGTPHDLAFPGTAVSEWVDFVNVVWFPQEQVFLFQS